MDHLFFVFCFPKNGSTCTLAIGHIAQPNIGRSRKAKAKQRVMPHSKWKSPSISNHNGREESTQCHQCERVYTPPRVHMNDDGPAQQDETPKEGSNRQYNKKTHNINLMSHGRLKFWMESTTFRHVTAELIAAQAVA